MTASNPKPNARLKLLEAAMSEDPYQGILCDDGR